MIELATEYAAVLHERDALRNELAERIEQIASGALQPQDAMAMLTSYLALQPSTPPIALRLEQRHFSVNSRRNSHNKERARRRRETAREDNPPLAVFERHSTAPSSLTRELSLSDILPEASSPSEDDLASYRAWLKGEEPEGFIPT